MRKKNLPFSDRARNQATKAVDAFPKCKKPDGDGAYLPA
jgi:hypothetical protein